MLKTSIVVLLSSLAFIIPAKSQTLQESTARGKEIYINECISCHMADGKGILGAFPPLVNSDYFSKNFGKAVDAIRNGLSGELKVNGQVYYGEMIPFELSDQEIADVLNYIKTNLEGKETFLKAEDISAFTLKADKN